MHNRYTNEKIIIIERSIDPLKQRAQQFQVKMPAFILGTSDFVLGSVDKSP